MGSYRAEGGFTSRPDWFVLHNLSVEKSISRHYPQ